MTAVHHVLIQVFMATLAVTVFLESSAAYDHRPDHDGPNEHQHHHNHSAANDTGDGERKFHWPSSVTIGIHRVGQIDPHTAQEISPNGPNNDTDGQRKFSWPSSVTFGIHRAGQIDPNAAQQISPNGPNNDPHNAPANDTDGERKFSWPGSMSIQIHRTGQVAQQTGPEGPNGGFKVDQEERLFGLIPVLVACNHTTQPGRTCADCTHSLLCFSNNLGVKRDCGPLYCNQGRCSLQPGASCNATSNE